VPGGTAGQRQPGTHQPGQRQPGASNAARDEAKTAATAADRAAPERTAPPGRYDPSPEVRRAAAQRAAQRLLDLAREQGDRNRDDDLDRHHRMKGPGRR
jgi:hypothetical protein